MSKTEKNEKKTWEKLDKKMKAINMEVKTEKTNKKLSFEEKKFFVKKLKKQIWTK